MADQRREESGREVARGPLRGLIRRIAGLYQDFGRERLPRLMLFVLSLILMGAGLVFLSELKANREMFTRYFDAFWWAVVTITTTGYGDRYPVTVMGRVFAIALMFLGVVSISILSGTIASIFVERKMREGKGLQDISLRGHTVICGWNRNAERILEGLLHVSQGRKVKVVLVNEMDAEEFQALAARLPDLDLRFVRGDFANEKVLKRACLNTAKSAILLSDDSGEKTLANADERTILAALAIKALNPDITTSAELLNPENEQHLIRANVEDILVSGEFNGFLLAFSTLSPAIPLLAKEMLSFASRKFIKQAPVPPPMVGKTFLELSEHFLKSGSGTLIGLLAEEKKISLGDILSEGSKAIDEFIRQKFAEAELDVFEGQKQQLKILLNPGAQYVVKATDSAFLIGAVE